MLRVNRDIRATEVRVIDEEGTMLGVFAPLDAVKIAEERGLDLIEIAPQAKPPTCRIMDYGKWRYETQQKEKAARKNQSVVSIKEIQIRPRTDDHDLHTKLKHARKFLEGGDKVKVNLRFSGREMAHQELGLQLLQKVIKDLDDVATVEAQPKKEGRQMFCLVAPDPVKLKEKAKAAKAEAAAKTPKKEAEGEQAPAEVESSS